jgi:hypothetical protein
MYKILLTILLGIFSQNLLAQTAIIRNPIIERYVNEVSSDSLKNYVEILADFHSRHTLNRDQKNGMPAAQNYVLDKFKSFEKDAKGRMSSEIERYIIPADGRRILQDSPAANVVATLKGTNPDDNRIFIISGHLDSRNKDVMDVEGIAPGANDDASGVAAVIEAARILAKSNFSATILFVAFAGEEEGLKGATYMADKAKADELNIVAVLNNDIVGNSNSSETNISDNTKVRIFSESIPLAETDQDAQIRRAINSENDSKSRQLARYIKEIGERYVDQMEVKLIYRSDRFLRGGDQTPFMRNGFTATRMSEMNENFYHQHENVRIEDGIHYGDLPEFMDFEYLRKVTAINLSTLAALSNSPDLPQEVKIDVRGLSNKSILMWNAPKIGKAVGYYVLMRETSSPVWEKKFYTSETSLTLPYSKDNYFFAVQSVSATGEESLAVIPVPLSR